MVAAGRAHGEEAVWLSPYYVRCCITREIGAAEAQPSKPGGHEALSRDE